MAYTLEAIIAKDEICKNIARSFKNCYLVKLEYSISMIPITLELFKEINHSSILDPVSKFEYLTKGFEVELIKAAGGHQFAYVESVFFGGVGGHIGVIWDKGRREISLPFKKDTMNKILRKLGVNREKGMDEFLVVGLDRYRNVEEWVRK